MLRNDRRASTDVNYGGAGRRWAVRDPQVAYSAVVSDFSGFGWNEYFWQTTVDLADRRLAALPVTLTFAPEGRGEEPLSDGELGLVRAAVADLGQVAATAVSALFSDYSAMQHQYGYDEAERASFMPDLHSIDDLYELIEIDGVNVHQVGEHTAPYVGIEFRCTWDEEHGAGVLLAGRRVVEVGGADTAILLWIAERDLNANNP